MINPYKKLKLRGNTSKENRAQSLLHSPIMTLHCFHIISVELYGPNSKVPVNEVINSKQLTSVPLSLKIVMQTGMHLLASFFIKMYIPVV